MDQTTFQRWWEIHLQVARGLSLSPEEKTLYEAGRQELEKEEPLREVQKAREVRGQLRALEGESTQLERRRLQLDREIAALEEKLQEQTRQLLGTGE